MLYEQSECSRVKRNQVDAQPILSIVRQRLHVSAVSRSITVRIQHFVLPVVLDGLKSIQDNRQSSKKNSKYKLLYTNGCTS